MKEFLEGTFIGPTQFGYFTLGQKIKRAVWANDCIHFLMSHRGDVDFSRIRMLAEREVGVIDPPDSDFGECSSD